MHLLVLEHEHDAPAALLAEHARRRGHTLDGRDATSAPPPTLAGHDAVIALGGTPSVTDPSVRRWLEPELALLRDADRRGIPVLGVCLGAQVLAVALGGSVERAPRWELGWMPVDTTDPTLVPPGPWFHWHEDRITPPPGATVVARTDLCVQAFTIGPHLGVQFHPEVTDVEVAAWADGRDDAGPLVTRTQALLPGARRRAAALLDAFLARVPAQAAR